MAEKKKRKGRRAYLNDFYADVNGKYIYTGDVYRYVDDKPFDRAYLRVGLLCGLVFISVFIVACLPVPSMLGLGKLYVILPFILEALGVLLTVWAAIRLRANGPDLRSYIWEATVKKLPWWLEMTAFFAGASVICNVIYLAINGFEGRAFLGLLAVALHIVAAVSALLGIRALRAMTWRSGEEENKPLPEPEA